MISKLSKPKCRIFALLATTLVLSACISKGLEMTEQQQRMARCDQYIDMARDECLRGDNVTISDYKTEYREFEKDVNDKMKAEQESAQKAAIEEEKRKEKKLKEAMEKAADKTKKPDTEKDS